MEENSNSHFTKRTELAEPVITVVANSLEDSDEYIKSLLVDNPAEQDPIEDTATTTS